QRLRWLALAFVPSSLLLSATTYLTTDLAAIPLLWVVPLALYLLTFILAFSRWPLVSHRLVLNLEPIVLVVLALALLWAAPAPVWLLLPLHLVGLFVVALACHGELARGRPPAQRLTEFYLWLSVGGALGGLFNGLLAPLLFNGVVEYPLVLVLACLLRPAAASKPVPANQKPGLLKANLVSHPHSRRDVLFPLGLAAATAVVILLVQAVRLPPG